MENIYPSLVKNLRTHKYFEDRTLLALTHCDVECINEKIKSIIYCGTRVYLSSDSVCKSEFQSGGNKQMLSVEFLNSIKCSRLLNHHLILKEGVSIMLLRNIDQKSDLYNGTRLIVVKLRRKSLICGYHISAPG